MASSSEKVLQLRQLLAERFAPKAAPSRAFLTTGLSLLDEVGLPQGALTELVSDSPAGTLLLYALLHAAGKQGMRSALIDGKDSFGPKALPEEDLQRMLWIRCHHASEAFQAIDLVARDGNFPLIILSLTLNAKTELRRLPATAWHRLQMLVEKSAAALVVFTPFALVGCARLRLSVAGDFPLRRLHSSRSELVTSIRLRVERRGMERRDDETLRCAACA